MELIVLLFPALPRHGSSARTFRWRPPFLPGETPDAGEQHYYLVSASLQPNRGRVPVNGTIATISALGSNGTSGTERPRAWLMEPQRLLIEALVLFC